MRSPNSCYRRWCQRESVVEAQRNVEIGQPHLGWTPAQNVGNCGSSCGNSTIGRRATETHWVKSFLGGGKAGPLTCCEGRERIPRGSASSGQRSMFFDDGGRNTEATCVQF